MHMRNVSETLNKLGAVAVLTVGERIRFGRSKAWSDDYKQGSWIGSPGRDVFVPKLKDADASLTSMGVSEKVADELLAGAGTTLAAARAKIDSALKPASLSLEGVAVKIRSVTKVKPIVGGNVIAMIEGSDPQLKKEAVIIGAHLDHIGINSEGYVFNGADDNASGSAGVLELAQAFALNPVRPKRSIIFACWTAEEKGLLGSFYFAKYPTLPDVKIIACLNMDMISRDMSLKELKELSISDKNFPEGVEISDDTAKRIITVSMSGQCDALEEITRRLIEDYADLVCIVNAGDEIDGGTDHYPFHLRKIPAMDFFAGYHEDYHQPGDTADKMNTEKMKQTIRLVYLTAFEIADRDKTIAWTDPE